MGRMKAKAKGIRRHVPAGVSRDDADEKAKAKPLDRGYNPAAMTDGTAQGPSPTTSGRDDGR